MTSNSQTSSQSQLLQASLPNPERISELSEALNEIRQRVHNAHAHAHANTNVSNPNQTIPDPILIAVSKLKPASDILACYHHGQRDFGENYVQELVDKAQQLPNDIRWHFIGTLQSNKAKALTSIPNLYAIQTVGSKKGADALNRALPTERESAPLNILLQVNTSGEESKSGLPPLLIDSSEENNQYQSSDLFDVAVHIIDNCPRLHLLGLMTIGSISESKNAGDANSDFERLKNTRDELERLLITISTRSGSGSFQNRNHVELNLDREEQEQEQGVDRRPGHTWGKNDRLLLSMGMSSDFEAALHAGSDFVRVGTSIFGERPKKVES